MTKGIKSSEFYVVLLVVVPWAMQYFGIDLSALQGEATRLAAEVTNVQSQNSDLPVWAAGAYVIGRSFIKWKKLGK